MNLEYLVVEEEEMYPDHCEEDTDGPKNGLCWRYARDLLREIDGVDCHVQRGDNAVSPLRSLGLVFHSAKST